MTNSNNEMISQIAAFEYVMSQQLYKVFEVSNTTEDKTEYYHNYNLRKTKVSALEK